MLNVCSCLEPAIPIMNTAQPTVSQRRDDKNTERLAPAPHRRLERASSSPVLRASHAHAHSQRLTDASAAASASHRRLPARSRYVSHDAGSSRGSSLRTLVVVPNASRQQRAAPDDDDLESSDLPSPSRTALADVDLYGRLNAHWDFKWTSERLAQLERDEALARKLQEQVRGS